MCEYCGNGFNNKPFYMDEHSTIQLDDDNNLDIDYEERFGWESMYYRRNIQINNCPMCGRKLTLDRLLAQEVSDEEQIREVREIIGNFEDALFGAESEYE